MFKGSIPALITPFKENKIDLVALEKLVECTMRRVTD